MSDPVYVVLGDDREVHVVTLDGQETLCGQPVPDDARLGSDPGDVLPRCEDCWGQWEESPYAE